MEEAAPKGDEFLYAGLNQDNGCFAVGCHNGFRVFNCEPFTEQVRPVSTTFALTACAHASMTVLLSICTGYGYAARARRAQNADASAFWLAVPKGVQQPRGRYKNCGDALPMQHPRPRWRWAHPPLSVQQGTCLTCNQTSWPAAPKLHAHQTGD